MKPIKEWMPKIFSNSKVPEWLSKVSPIEIYAISFGWWVWCRGNLDLKSIAGKTRREAAAETVRHETIHFQQQLELLFVGQWLLYVFYWLKGLIKYKDGAVAYRESPFEREAYENDQNLNYLKNRERFAWRKHI